MRLPPAEPTHTATASSTMSCEQEFGDGAVGVTLTLRLLMHGKVRGAQSGASGGGVVTSLTGQLTMNSLLLKFLHPLNISGG